MLIAVLLLIVFAGVYELLEAGAFIPHHQTVNLYSDEGWQVGEMRDCEMTVANDSPAVASGTLSLRCPGLKAKQSMRIAMIRFWGIVTSHDLIGLRVTISPRWRCIRHTDGIVCRSSR